jgi:hypothetical protein
MIELNYTYNGYNEWKLKQIELEEAFIQRMCMDYPIREVTTDRQKKNGTREFMFESIMASPSQNLRLATFKSGYVRKQNGCHSPYQINKKYMRKTMSTHMDENGDMYENSHMEGARALISSQLARLNYMLNYALRNYNLKRSVRVEKIKHVNLLWSDSHGVLIDGELYIKKN